MNVIIHVGLHKTATTFLQKEVWPQLTSYTYLTRPYTQHNHAFNQLQYADDSLYSKELVAKEIEKIGAGKLLISDESLSGKPIFFSYMNRSMIARRLKELLPSATIVLFIRDQKDIMLSHYSSYIKMPYGVKGIQEFFWKPQENYTYDNYLSNPDAYDLDTLYYNTNDYFIHVDSFLYIPLINLYAELFDKVHIFLYEEFKEDKGLVINRLEEITGQKIKIDSDIKINKSLSYRELEKKRKNNILLAYIKNRYAKKLFKIFFSKMPASSNDDLSVVIAKFIGNYYSEDNKLLKKSYPDLNWDKFPDKYS